MKPLVLRSAIVAALGGLIFGFDTAVISGAVDQIQSVFGLSDAKLGFTVTTALIGTIVGALTAGCVINSPSLGSLKPTKVSTVSGMAQIALEGELYFNLHTTSQTYFGDIRGQIHAVDKGR